MPAKIIERVVADLRTRSAAGGDGAPPADAALLDAFLARGDEAAFAALVQRHGPMVLGVCRRILGHAQDAEDAFQAVFWVLSRKANGIRPRAWVGNWLYGVAVRTALKVRGLRRRRREHQVDAMPPQPTPPTETDRDAQAILDEEIERLPAKYRLAVVLCELEGRGRKEAAAQLGVPEGTLSSRLAYARRLLAKRLQARGVTLGTGVAALIGKHAAQAAVSQALLTTTIQTANATGPASAAVASLAKGVMAAMLLGKLKKMAAALVICAAVLGLSFGLGPLGAQPEGPKARAETQDKKASPAEQAPAKGKKPSAPAQDSVLGLWRLLRIDTKNQVEPELFDNVAGKATVHITQNAMHSNIHGQRHTHKIRIGAGLIDLQQEELGEDFNLGTYKLDGNRLQLYFGGTEEKSRAKGPKDALQSWTLIRLPSRQEIYQQLDRLQGHWHAVSGEFKGQAFLPRELEDVVLSIENDRWLMAAPNETAQPDAVPRTLFGKELRFVLETTGERDYVVLKVEGKHAGDAFVLYELRGNELKVCWDAGWSAQAGQPIPDAPIGQFVRWNEAPKEFKTAFGSDLVMFVLKPDEPTPPPPSTPDSPQNKEPEPPPAKETTALPAEMTILDPRGVEVRSGPSLEYYPTSQLQFGDKVLVLHESKSWPDWYAIKPPPGSFSWIRGHHVEIVEERIGIVPKSEAGHVPVLPGSSLVNKEPSVETIKLAPGMRVTILDRPMQAKGEKWYPIVPPPDEVRFIPKAAVMPQVPRGQNWTRMPGGADQPTSPSGSGASATKMQILITGANGMKVRLFEAKEEKIAPARFTFAKPGTYRLKLSNIPDRPGKVYYPTIEIPAVTAPHAVAFLANSYVPLEFVDFDAADQGFVATNYCILPGDEDKTDAPVESRVQFSRTRPAANAKMAVLAIVRLGGIDLDSDNVRTRPD